MLGAAAFPVHVWAIISVMRQIPAWILRLSVGDIAAVIAYTLLFTLLETLLLFAGVVIVAMLLPRRWLADRLVPLATTALFVTAIWFVILQYNGNWITDRQIVPIGAWAASYLVVTAGALFLVFRKTAVAQGLHSFTQRLLALSGLYLAVDLIGLVYIIARNL